MGLFLKKIHNQNYASGPLLAYAWKLAEKDQLLLLHCLITQCSAPVLLCWNVRGKITNTDSTFHHFSWETVKKWGYKALKLRWQGKICPQKCHLCLFIENAQTLSCFICILQIFVCTRICVAFWKLLLDCLLAVYTFAVVPHPITVLLMIHTSKWRELRIFKLLSKSWTNIEIPMPRPLFINLKLLIFWSCWMPSFAK